MKAGELISCEPFGVLFERTTSRFLRLRFGGEWKVRWRSGRPPITSDAQRWLVNLDINAVFHPGAADVVFEVVRQEFSSSPVPWKRPLQRAYFGAATSKLFARAMAQAAVDVSPAVPGAENWLIVAGTHKIRYIDTRDKKVYCCLKEESPISHFEREIEAREMAAKLGVSVPVITEKVGDGCIVEEMVAGTPLNRLANTDLQRRCVIEAQSSMEKLYQGTVENERAVDYVREVVAEICAVVPRVKMLAPYRHKIELILNQIADGFDRSEAMLPIVQCHGDFQPANILWNGNRTWIIDWEFSARRQRAYDTFVYRLQSRFPRGLTSRIRQLLHQQASPREMVLQLRCFLLEELSFRCEEAAVSKHLAIAPTFLDLLNEAEGVLRLLVDEENTGKPEIPFFQTDGAAS